MEFLQPTIQKKSYSMPKFLWYKKKLNKNYKTLCDGEKSILFFFSEISINLYDMKRKGTFNWYSLTHLYKIFNTSAIKLELRCLRILLKLEMAVWYLVLNQFNIGVRYLKFSISYGRLLKLKNALINFVIKVSNWLCAYFLQNKNYMSN